MFPFPQARSVGRGGGGASQKKRLGVVSMCLERAAGKWSAFWECWNCGAERLGRFYSQAGIRLTGPARFGNPEFGFGTQRSLPSPWWQLGAVLCLGKGSGRVEGSPVLLPTQVLNIKAGKCYLKSAAALEAGGSRAGRNVVHWHVCRSSPCLSD